ncbi:hypothetical protein D3C81_1918500 [compost metagenome]
MLLTCTGCPLNHQSGVSVDRRCQIFGQPGFSRSRFSDQQQRPVCDQSSNGHFDQPRITDIFRGNDLTSGLPPGDECKYCTR